ncbi:hypothetical protein PP304_gp058 [Gordonia phage Phendrix]|uniref:Uncharacterized protein n=2 Tax=Godonkavirus TaxID=2733178 RepID=A0A4D6E217_9CAUD|nr:hypothetical protein HOV33_gp059 [Gordonia phage GodonK]YP_010649102.1 hypothetical protein PP304_gp058 [Gordonia phage Phendrix]QBZ72678.1 hypothetical protein SEA_GODONK_59 [Gordonia phage GodonK]QDK02606.1 hypothetical protein SEA_PHENDRIX_58 [Gordonia phage Phendrix]
MIEVFDTKMCCAKCPNVAAKRTNFNDGSEEWYYCARHAETMSMHLIDLAVN